MNYMLWNSTALHATGLLLILLSLSIASVGILADWQGWKSLVVRLIVEDWPMLFAMGFLMVLGICAITIH